MPGSLPGSLPVWRAKCAIWAEWQEWFPDLADICRASFGSGAECKCDGHAMVSATQWPRNGFLPGFMCV